jgi:hypothetical protein
MLQRWCERIRANTTRSKKVTRCRCSSLVRVVPSLFYQFRLKLIARSHFGLLRQSASQNSSFSQVLARYLRLPGVNHPDVPLAILTRPRSQFVSDGAESMRGRRDSYSRCTTETHASALAGDEIALDAQRPCRFDAAGDELGRICAPVDSLPGAFSVAVQLSSTRHDLEAAETGCL